MVPKTVIESARLAAGLSQRRLAELARTQQSSVSEYESRRKSPTLEVVERLLEAADAELAVRPMVFWEFIEDPEIGRFGVPDRLWSVPIPECFARVQAWKYVFPAEVYSGWSEDLRVWDLADEGERVAFYELVLQHGAAPMIEGAVAASISGCHAARTGSGRFNRGHAWTSRSPSTAPSIIGAAPCCNTSS